MFTHGSRSGVETMLRVLTSCLNSRSFDEVTVSLLSFRLVGFLLALLSCFTKASTEIGCSRSVPSIAVINRCACFFSCDSFFRGRRSVKFQTRLTTRRMTSAPRTAFFCIIYVRRLTFSSEERAVPRFVLTRPSWKDLKYESIYARETSYKRQPFTMLVYVHRSRRT